MPKGYHAHLLYTILKEFKIWLYMLLCDMKQKYSAIKITILVYLYDVSSQFNKNASQINSCCITISTENRILKIILCKRNQLYLKV